MSFRTKIKEVYTKDNYILICKFENGVKKEYDLKQLIEKYPIFRKLQTDNILWNKITVDNGGYGVSWDDEIDLAAEEIWNKGETVS